MDRIKYMINQLIDVCSKTKTKLPLIAKDNRLGKNYLGSMHPAKKKTNGKTVWLMRYNEKRITKEKLSKCYIKMFICHEIGHIRTKGKTLEEREYKAEKFALNTIRKYYPEYYQRALQETRIVAKYAYHKVYRVAFAKLLKEIENGMV